MLEIIVTLILCLLVVFCIRFYRFTSLESYGILQKEIDILTRYYIETKLIPYASIPNNELTKEELENYRLNCIKFVIQTLNRSPLYRIKKNFYDDEYLAHLIDHKFIMILRQLNLKGVKA